MAWLIPSVDSIAPELHEASLIFEPWQRLPPLHQLTAEAIRHFGPADFRARIAEARTLLGDQSPAPGVAKEHA